MVTTGAAVSLAALAVAPTLASHGNIVATALAAASSTAALAATASHGDIAPRPTAASHGDIAPRAAAASHRGTAGATTSSRLGWGSWGCRC